VTGYAGGKNQRVLSSYICKTTINSSCSLRLGGGLREHSQEELGLLVGVERARNDDVLAWLQLTMYCDLTEVDEPVW